MQVIIATLEAGGKKIVKIFVLLKDEASAGKAIKALDKRWFGGKVCGHDSDDCQSDVRMKPVLVRKTRQSKSAESQVC